MKELHKGLVLGWLIALILGIPAPASGQAVPDAWPLYDLNMRTGPGTGYASITQLAPQTGLILEARNANTAWVLGHTLDGRYRGWVATLYLGYRDGFSPTGLPMSSEIVTAAAPPAPAESAAPEGVTAMTAYNNVNVRRGPGTGYGSLGHLQPGMVFMIEARSSQATWLLGHTSDGALRGWASSSYLALQTGTAATLPVSEEVIAGPAAVAAPAAAPSTSGARPQYGLPDVSGIDLNSYPVIPAVTNSVYQIAAVGRARGMNPHVVGKAGDCGTDSPDFLGPFFWGPYDLGNYGYLQGVINHFGESLAYASQAAGTGFVADAVIDPQWANPTVCRPQESALQCEIRLHKPGVIVIMFGLTDLQRRTPAQFYSDLRTVVDQSIDAGVIPVLSTFPRYLAFPEESVLFNQIVVRVALDYDLPLINFWRAMEPLPNHGMMEDGTHMTMYTVGGAGYLVDANLQYGFALRNLVTLQTLDVIWQAALR
jgi:uncharacterized protein YraI